MSEVKVIEAKYKQVLNDEKQIKSCRRVAAYARVSTNKDDQIQSYTAQISYYRRMINSRKDWIFVGIYTDEGMTGTSIRKRKGFLKMISDVEKGKIDLIVTKSISRFARNTVDSLQSIRKLSELNCEIFFEKENISTFDSTGELLITIMSSLAQEESRSISENVSWGIRESMRNGKAYVPYRNFMGYDRGPDGEMVINKEQAKVVQRIFNLYLSGLTEYQIACILMKEGVPSPSGRKTWYYSVIKNMLQNEKYVGDALRQKTYTRDFLSKKKMINKGELEQYYIKNHHEPIIDRETFEKVKFEMLKREAKKCCK